VTLLEVGEIHWLVGDPIGIAEATELRHTTHEADLTTFETGREFAVTADTRLLTLGTFAGEGIADTEAFVSVFGSSSWTNLMLLHLGR
jgi:hypothetical protein